MTDIKPDGRIEPGETLFSKSGRQLSPVPHFNPGGGGQRRINKALQDWLVAEAQAEGVDTGANRWCADALAEMNPRNISPMDAAFLREVLFGDESGPTMSNRAADTLAAARAPQLRAQRAFDASLQRLRERCA